MNNEIKNKYNIKDFVLCFDELLTKIQFYLDDLSNEITRLEYLKNAYYSGYLSGNISIESINRKISFLNKQHSHFYHIKSIIKEHYNEP